MTLLKKQFTLGCGIKEWVQSRLSHFKKAAACEDSDGKRPREGSAAFEYPTGIDGWYREPSEKVTPGKSAAGPRKTARQLQL